MSRRQRLIGEMGLGPVWVLRSRDAATVAPQPEAGELSEGMPGESVLPARTARGGAEQPVENRRPPQRPREPAAGNGRSSGAPAPARAGSPARTGSPARPLAPELPALGNEERNALIARMDWTALKGAVSGCAACGLATTRTQTVFGVGDEMADWMLVGEAPGADEDVRGEPFVGQAGKLLDNMLFAIELARDKNVYIANVLKCRPPGNRNPAPEEVARCSPHLARQVALVQPRLILALGRFAAQTLLGTDASIASLRGKLHQYQGVPVIVTYHPAYLLRNLLDKAKAWEDLVFARRTMRELKAAGGDAASATSATSATRSNPPE
jgi:uracil-DNA glycosylase family 4